MGVRIINRKGSRYTGVKGLLRVKGQLVGHL